MDGDKAYSPLCYHVAGHGAVYAPGEQGYRHAVGAHGHAPGPGHRGGVDIGGQVPHLYMDGELRVMDIHHRVRVGVGQLAPHILAQLYAGHGEGLVAALGLHLEALCPLHIIPEIFYCQPGNGLLVLLAAGGPAEIYNAEDLPQSLEGGVHVGALRPLHVNRGLHAVDPEIPYGGQAAAHIGQQLLLKALAVEALEDYLPQLQKNDVVHVSLRSAAMPRTPGMRLCSGARVLGEIVQNPCTFHWRALTRQWKYAL